MTELGLPAYDISKSLIGFYRQGDDFGVTVPVFASANSITMVDDMMVQRLTRQLDDYLRGNDPSLFSLLKYTNYFEMASEATIYDMCNTFPDNCM